MRMRALLKGLCMIALGAALVVPTAGSAAAHPHPRLPDRIGLPDGFQPEGITISKRGIAYFGSRTDGSIYAANLRTGAGRIISPGSEGTLSIGLKIDKRKRLWVAGGPGGNARVISARTGAVLQTYSFTEAPTFVNDVILGRKAAYFTDSRRPQLYVVPFLRHRHGALAPQSAVRTLPLTGDWEQIPDANNANGIAITPDRRALLVVQSATGFLFRVDPSTGVATRVNLGDTLLTNGDGLLVKGHTLYVVQNRLNQIAVIRLNNAGTAGTLRRTITSPDFDIPTTVAAYKRGLYLPNARFGVANADTTAEYWVTRVHR